MIVASGAIRSESKFRSRGVGAGSVITASADGQRSAFADTKQYFTEGVKF
jgi:hypothetical protein